jgi:hypothetical protein
MAEEGAPVLSLTPQRSAAPAAAAANIRVLEASVASEVFLPEMAVVMAAPVLMVTQGQFLAATILVAAALAVILELAETVVATPTRLATLLEQPEQAAQAAAAVIKAARATEQAAAASGCLALALTEPPAPPALTAEVGQAALTAPVPLAAFTAAAARRDFLAALALPAQFALSGVLTAPFPQQTRGTCKWNILTSNSTFKSATANRTSIQFSETIFAPHFLT